MAQSFATLDELSGGRAIVGLGVSHRSVVEAWYGQRIDKPLREMREYASVLRAILRGEDPPPSERFGTSFHFMGYEPRPGHADLPGRPVARHAAAGGRDRRRRGALALQPDYIRDVVVPTVAEGREQAGKPAAGFDIVAAVPSAVVGRARAGEGADARRADSLLLAAVLSQDARALGLLRRPRRLRPRHAGGAARTTPPPRSRSASCRTWPRSAAPEEAAATVRRYADSGTTSPCIGGISKTDFDATLEALAGSLA